MPIYTTPPPTTSIIGDIGNGEQDKLSIMFLFVAFSLLFKILHWDAQLPVFSIVNAKYKPLKIAKSPVKPYNIRVCEVLGVVKKWVKIGVLCVLFAYKKSYKNWLKSIDKLGKVCYNYIDNGEKARRYSYLKS